MMRRIHKLMLAALVGIAWLSSSSTAEASFKLRVSDGVKTITITDQDFSPATPTTAPDGDATASSISYSANGVFSGFTVLFTAGLSSPLIGSASSKELDLTSVSVISVGSGSITIDLTNTDFTLPADGPGTLKSAISGNVTNGSVSFQSWVDFRNSGQNEFGGIGVVDPNVYTSGLQGPLTGNFANTVTTITAPAQPTPFSLTNRTVVTFGSGGGSFGSTDGHTTLYNPEPATLALAAAGLPFFGAGLLRRLRKAKVAVA